MNIKLRVALELAFLLLIGAFSLIWFGWVGSDPVTQRGELVVSQLSACQGKDCVSWKESPCQSSAGEQCGDSALRRKLEQLIDRLLLGGCLQIWGVCQPALTIHIDFWTRIAERIVFIVILGWLTVLLTNIIRRQSQMMSFPNGDTILKPIFGAIRSDVSDIRREVVRIATKMDEKCYEQPARATEEPPLSEGEEPVSEPIKVSTDVPEPVSQVPEATAEKPKWRRRRKGNKTINIHIRNILGQKE